MLKNKKNYKKLSVVLVVLFILSLFITVVVAKEPFKVKAENDSSFIGYECTGNIYSATNTFNYNTTSKKYNISETGKNSNAVDNDSAPLITVLTHGLDCNASVWSNQNGQFSKDDESIISKINSLYYNITQKNANVYWAKMTGMSNFELYPLIESNMVKNIYVQNNTDKYITDISKHMIIVFEAINSGKSNDYIYEQFNYMLSKIVYDVKYLNDGELPKINLIGHSRGWYN